jgi:predicted porin
MGRVTYGRDNVWWGNGAIEQVGANWLNAGGQLYSGSFGRGMSVGITRQSNLMQYTSPTFSGVNFVVSLSPSRSEAQPVATNADGKLMGVTAQGTHGPLAWGLDYVVDEGNTPAGGKQGSTTGTKIRVGYRYMPAGQISFLSVASELEAGGPTNAAFNANGLVASCATSGCILEQSGAGISWDHMFGPFHPIFQYYAIKKISGSGCTLTVCDNTGANQVTLALRYIFSKRTHAYVSYNKIDNETNYNQDFNGAALTARAGTSAALTAAAQAVGADPTIIAVGLMHNF